VKGRTFIINMDKPSKILRSGFTILGMGFLFCFGLFLLIELFFQINSLFHWIRPVFPEAPYVKESKELTEKRKSETDLSFLKTHPDFIPPGMEWQQDEELDQSDRWPEPTWSAEGEFMPKGKFRSIVRLKRNSKEIYNIQYEFDRFHRRVVPGQSTETKKRSVLVFGNSLALGEGVQDDETLPAQLAKHLPSYQIYNLGGTGYTPNHILKNLQNKNFPRHQGINEPTGISVLLFTDQDINRVIGRFSEIRANRWRALAPCFELESGKLLDKGNFWTGKPLTTLFFTVLGFSEFFKFLNLDYPGKITDAHLALYSAIVAEIKTQVKIQFASKELFILFYPGKSQKHGYRLRPLLEKEGLKILDYSKVDLWAIKGSNPNMAIDRHPGAGTYWIISELLAKDIVREATY